MQKACRRGVRMAQFLGETVRSQLEPFFLEKMYPLVDFLRKNGTWGRRHEVMPHQQKVHDGISISGRKAKAILFSGGVGSGKTICICIQLLYFLKTYPGIRIVVTTAFDYYFVEFLLPKWREVLDDDDPFVVAKNVKDRWYKMANGSEIRFHAYDDPEKIRGWEAHIIWIEEAAQIGHGNNDLGAQIFVALTQRLRAKPNNYPRIIFVSQNPSGHNWVWKVFIKSEPSAPQPLGDKGRITVWGKDDSGNVLKYHEWEKITASGDVYYTVVTSSFANKHLPGGYIATMLGAMADQKGTRERMVEGMFTPINSLVYEAPVYSEETHCIDYQRFLDFFEYDYIPPWVRVVVGIDCGGQRSPWAVEYYMQTEPIEGYEPHWVCFDEIYMIGDTWNDIADKILEKEEKYGFRNIEYFIDPISSNQRQGPTSVTIKDEFKTRGIHTNMPKGYNKYGAIARVHSFLDRDRKVPCPYMDDEQILNEDGTFEFVNGHARLYYLKGVPGKSQEVIINNKKILQNPEGYAAPGNIAEKSVYRYDNTKQREGKASEEGLTPVLSQKIMDRDDHGQTSEFFAFLGISPLPPSEGRGRTKKSVDPQGPGGMYGRTTKHRRM